MLTDDPKQRLTLKQALGHQWLTHTDKVIPLLPQPVLANQTTTTMPTQPSASSASSPDDLAPAGGGVRRQWTKEDFSVEEEIGSGHFGCVYRCVHKESGKEVAIKVLFKEELKRNGVDHQLHNEVEIHCAVNHPYIIKCWGYFQDETRGEQKPSSVHTPSLG